MRRAYLDFTGEFARSADIGQLLPTAWNIVGSTMSPAPGVVRLILQNDHIDPGPFMFAKLEIDEDLNSKTIRVVLTEVPS